MVTTVGNTDVDTVSVSVLHARRGYDGRTLANDLKCLDALEEHTITIADARRLSNRSLHRNGFALLQHKSALADPFDHQALKTQYAEEIKGLIAELAGSDKAVVVDTVLRGSLELAAAHPDNRIYEYAFKAHTDGDGETFLHMAEIADPEMTAKYRNGNFAVYGFWRPLGPVEQKPLALCDAQTVNRDDLVAAYYSGFDDLAEKHPDLDYPPPAVYFHLAYNPDQCWYYYPDMTPDEMLVHKQWDSDPDKLLCVPHTAFEDPNTRPDPAPRTALEARVVVFY